ncbi:MAG TPA: hypothetical protein VFM16_09020 [Holophagaceae bacterium]|nr:hypothetical protein [Holophagaceae bacterium]
MTKPLVPADLLKSLANLPKTEEESGAKSAPKAKPAPAASVKVNTKAQGKGNAMHTRSSNRGK